MKAAVRKNKSNISLLNLSEMKNSGILLALRKGANELLGRTGSKAPVALPKRAHRQYQKKISVII